MKTHGKEYRKRTNEKCAWNEELNVTACNNNNHLRRRRRRRQEQNENEESWAELSWVGLSESERTKWLQWAIEWIARVKENVCDGVR